MVAFLLSPRAASAVTSAVAFRRSFWASINRPIRPFDESESEDEVDESVVEDMRKLEESFKGISQKYRLINRIGEGEGTSDHVTQHHV